MKSLQQDDRQREDENNVHDLVRAKLPGTFALLAAELWAAAVDMDRTTMSAALRRVLSWRLEEAEEILGEELGRIKGRLTRVGEVEQASGMVLRYIRAAKEGTGSINLRIMAKTMRGLALQSRLQASLFLRFADVVSSLTIEELVAIASLYEKTVELGRQGIISDRDSQAWSLTSADLVPRYFDDEQQLALAFLTGARTGLVTKSKPFKLGPFSTTPLLHDLASLVSFRRAIIDEGHDF